jgi:hypothetical protein
LIDTETGKLLMPTGILRSADPTSGSLALANLSS